LQGIGINSKMVRHIAIDIILIYVQTRLNISTQGQRQHIVHIVSMTAIDRYFTLFHPISASDSCNSTIS